MRSIAAKRPDEELDALNRFLHLKTYDPTTRHLSPIDQAHRSRLRLRYELQLDPVAAPVADHDRGVPFGRKRKRAAREGAWKMADAVFVQVKRQPVVERRGTRIDLA
jgi:hypothetical protein